MSRRLEGKVAIVTGAGRGLGESIARYLAAEERCSVVVNDVDAGSAARAAAGIMENGGSAVEAAGDVGSSEDVKALVAKTVEKFGRVDILVNNAGVLEVAHIFNVTDEQWDRTMRVNLKGTFLCSREVARHMADNGIKGKIINVSSKSGKQAGLWLSSYCTSKFGISGLTQSLALDLAEHGINVNAVCPGIVRTPLWDSLDREYSKKLGILPEEVRAHYASKIPLGRESTGEDVAKVIAFLASEDAAYMTGQAINVTGGQEMR